jgi:hypothetical protein
MIIMENGSRMARPHRRRVVAAISAGVLGFAALVLGAQTAQADTAPTSTVATDPGVQASCTVTPRGNDLVRVRSAPRTNAGEVSAIFPGFTYPALCSSTPGGFYTCFGLSGSYWIWARGHDGDWGYVAGACAIWTQVS